MNNHHHQHGHVPGPCAEFEFDLVDLLDGALEPGRAETVRKHMTQCPRCRAHAHSLSEIDAALADALPRPVLSTGFDARLREQIAELTRAPDRNTALATAEREHESMLQGLGRGLGWRTILNAAALASVVGGMIVGLDVTAPGLLQSFGLVGPGMSATLTFSLALGAVFAVCGVVFAQRPASGVLQAL
jgi:anti-sigma factor RsiW